MISSISDDVKPASAPTTSKPINGRASRRTAKSTPRNTGTPTNAATDTLQQRHGGQILLPKRTGNIVGGLKVPRVFSNAAAHPYDEIRWEHRDIEIRNEKGVVVYVRTGMEVPATWGPDAVRITVEKYFYGSKAGTPEYEDSLKQVFDRIANTYTVWGWEEGYFAELTDALVFNEELKAMLVKQLWAPNSPVWFNLGHWEQWRWGRPDLRPLFRGKGNKAYYAKRGQDGFTVHTAEHAYAVPQTSACFLTEVADSFETVGTGLDAVDGIMEHQRTESRIFSSGSGVGINISNLRSSFEPIGGKGRSSGPIAFNSGWDRMAGGIKSGGKTRRAARMVILSADHPDIFKFVETKRKQDDIAKIILRDHNTHIELRKLASQKLQTGTFAEKAAARIILALPLSNETVYSSHMDGFLYGETLSDQNSNHSVSCKGEFWAAHRSNGEYATRWVTDSTHVERKYRPDELLTLMADSVYENGEPGIHNNDWMNLWNPVKADGDITTGNPCSEFLHIVNTSCNLSSGNLARFYDKVKRVFRVSQFCAFVRLAMIVADLNVERSGLPTPQLALGTYRYRTTGIGYANLGGLLMAMGIPYDSDEARFIGAQITSLLTATAWNTSAEMGSEFGAYDAFDRTQNDLRQVLMLHRVSQDVLTRLAVDPRESLHASIRELAESHRADLPSAQGLTGYDALNAFARNFVSEKPLRPDVQSFIGDIRHAAEKQWANVTSGNKRFRNSFVSVLAPTGTISAPLGCYDEGTTSAEPDYSLVKMKQLSGGGYLRMFNTLALEGLRSLGYSEDLVREAAFEVAGVLGLRAICGDTDMLVRHLGQAPASEKQGPVRKAFAELAAGVEIDRLLLRLESEKDSANLDDNSRLVLSGSSHVERIPWLKPEHLATFDCSASNGDGVRSIQHRGHLLMLGALQPFLSGATSKTVNLPASATREEIKECFVLSHECGVKCIAIFRADSKANSVYMVDTPETRLRKPAAVWQRLVDESDAAIKDVIAEASKPKQRKLPGRRQAQTVKFSIGGILTGFITVGVYPDGTCGEIFGRLGQVGSFASSMFEAKCKEMSESLQWGKPLSVIIESNRGFAFEPSGFCKVGDDGDTGVFDGIKSCSSVIDLMAKILEWLFPAENDYRLRDVGAAPMLTIASPSPVPAGSATVRAKPTVSKAASAASATMCPRCTNLTYVPDGHCKKCRSCGYQDGGCGE